MRFINKVKGEYRDLRTLISWIKNFGFKNACFMRRIDQCRKTDMYGMWNPTAEMIERARKEYEESNINIVVVSALEDCNKAKVWNEAIQKSDAEYFLCKNDDIQLSELALWAIQKRIVNSGKKTNQVYYCDHKVGDEFIYKPDFGIDTFLAQNYIKDMLCVSKEIWNELGGFDEKFSNAAIYDFVLRCYEKFGEESISHVEKAVFTLDECEKTTDVSQTQEQEIEVIESHLKRMDKKAKVHVISNGLYQVEYSLVAHAKISIVIPNKDNIDVLKQCIDSILDKSTYDNYEIVIIENNSEDSETFQYYQEIEQKYPDVIRVLKCVTDWNYSYINNFGVKQTTGEYIVLLNNDTEVIAPDWMEQLLQYAQQKEIGIVGAKLLYPDGTIQHGGVTLGIRGVAGHAFHGWNGDAKGYMNRLITVQDLTAVTAACLMISREVFDEVRGLDERFKVAFNDTDLCMRVRKAGYRVVYNPKACLFHHESKSRGTDEQSPEKLKRFNGESMRFQKLYCRELTLGDPYYNFNLEKTNDDFVAAKWE